MIAIPEHLNSTKAQGAFLNQPIGQFELGEHQNFIYLVMDWKSKQVLWVDPQLNLTEPLDFLKRNQFMTKGILLTHTHFDHIAGVPTLLSLFHDSQLYVHRNDLYRLPESIRSHNNLRFIEESDQINLGETSITVMHTPGHSAGCCCYHVQADRSYLLTGDTLFIEDCGRTDLPSGDDQQMFESLQKIKELPKNTIILPGHHYRRPCASTLATELIHNPALQCKNVQELKELN
jgi:hydroxyacylglutathione hydrolase